MARSSSRVTLDVITFTREKVRFMTRSHLPTRARAITGAGILLLVATVGFTGPTPAPPPPIALTVYKDPSCGCCHTWVEYLRAQGFQVTVIDTSDMQPIKARYGVPANLASCHTAKVGRYVIEGHVPAELIQQLVREHPAVAGLTVPGMVAGSPGMESAHPQHYDVLSFDRAGKTAVYARR